MATPTPAPGSGAANPPGGSGSAAAGGTPTVHHSLSTGDAHLFDRIAVVYKYRWACLTVFLLVVGWVMVDSYTRVPIYRASARVLIEDPNNDIATPSEITRNVTVQDPEMFLETQLRIIRGRDLAQRVATDLHLERVPEFNGQGPKPTQLARTIATIKHYAAWPYRLVTSSTSIPPVVPPSTSAANNDHADALMSRLNVEQVRGSQLVDLTFDSSDRAFAATAANAIAEEYVADNLALKVRSLEKSAEWLTGEVERMRKLVQASELALAQYRTKQDAGSLGSGQNIIVARLTQLNEAVTKARTDRIQKEGVWKQVRAAGQDLESISAVIANAGVQNLRNQLNALLQDRTRITERYGEKHPEYIKVNTQIANTERQLEAEIKKAVQNAKNEYDAAVTQERVLQESLNESKSAATDLGRKGVDYSVLERDAESNRQVYNQLVTREKELRVVANSRTNNVRIVDRAQVPGEPFTPNHRRDWIFALAFGLAFGIAIAFGLDYLDDTVKTPEDVTRRLKLRFLGLVPAVTGERHPLISGPVPHDFGEAYRSIRTSLASQLPGNGPRLVAVASSQPLEGKTTTAVNIAMALAVGGARVLLIDADMRRPSVHKALRLTNERGLSQLLAGQARMREVVQRTHDPNLLTITAGRTPANPSELLASDRMRALVSGLETGPFDWVVIDTPPVLAVTDAVILAPLVTAVTFVVGAEMTRWRLAERAVETLLSSNPRMVLAVLNKVNFDRNKYLLLALLRTPVQELLRRIAGGLIRAASAAHLTRRGLVPAVCGRSVVVPPPDSPVGRCRRRRQHQAHAGVSAHLAAHRQRTRRVDRGDGVPIDSTSAAARIAAVAARPGGEGIAPTDGDDRPGVRMVDALGESRRDARGPGHGAHRRARIPDRALGLQFQRRHAAVLPVARVDRGDRRNRGDSAAGDRSENGLRNRAPAGTERQSVRRLCEPQSLRRLAADDGRPGVRIRSGPFANSSGVSGSVAGGAARILHVGRIAHGHRRHRDNRYHSADVVALGSGRPRRRRAVRLEIGARPVARRAYQSSGSAGSRRNGARGGDDVRRSRRLVDAAAGKPGPGGPGPQPREHLA